MIHMRTRVCLMQNAHADVRTYARLCLGVTRAHERAVRMAELY